MFHTQNLLVVIIVLCSVLAVKAGTFYAAGFPNTEFAIEVPQ